MSDRIGKMKKDIKVATAVVIVVYLIAFTYLLFPEQVATALQKLDVSKLPVIGTIFTILGLPIASYLVMGDLHNWLDKVFFGERGRVDDYIIDCLTGPCREAQCQRALSLGVLKEERPKIGTQLFLSKLIPADDTERERAFSYFTEYFIAVNLSIASFVGIGATTIVMIFVPRNSFIQEMVVLFLMVLCPAMFNILRYRTKKKLIYPAEAQISRIFNDQLDELKRSLPAYRIYGNGTSCAKSGQCPLRIEQPES